MAPRITVSRTEDGVLQMFLNEEGRDLLVKELAALSRTNDHFHLDTFDGAEVQLQSQPYKTTDELIDSAKVLFRPDEWDMQYYPHVMAGP